MNLKDKVVLITGSASGIGRTAAIRSAQEGANIIINYRTNKKGAEETIDEITRLGRKAYAIQADITDPNQVRRLFQEAADKLGTVDILVNNAGLAKPKSFLEITRDDLHAEFEENFFSMVYCSQEAAKLMLKKGSGKIINVSSICGLTGCTSILTFSSARSALTGFTKSLAKILAPNITVNIVAPGFTQTRFWDKMSKNEVDKLLETTLSKKWITPDEIAEAFIYLAKNDSVTGQILVVDGGYTTTI